MIAAWFSAVVAAGAEPLFGPGRLAAGLTLAGENRDNLYLSSGTPSSAFFTIVAPAVRVRFAGGRQYLLEARYRGEYRSCTLEPSRNTVVNHEAFVGAVYRMPQGITIAVSDEYRRTTDPPFWELVEYILHSDERTKLEVAYRAQEIVSFAMRYERVSRRYDDPQYHAALTGYEQRVSLSGDIRVTPKTAVRLGIDAGNCEYEDGANPRDGGVLDRYVGVTGMLTPKTTGHIVFGYVTRGFWLFDQPSYSAVTTRVRTDTGFTPRTVLRLEADQSVNDSMYGENRLYTATRGAAVLTQRIGAAIRAELEGSMAWHAYPRDTGTPRRSDVLFRWGLSCILGASRDVALRVSYVRESRDSTVPACDYEDTTVGVSLHWGS